MDDERTKEQEKNERRKITAMALDIAVKLTNVDHSWIKEDDNGNIEIKEPLFTTFRLVMGVINYDFFMAVSGVPKVVQGIMREASDKSQM